MSAPSGDDSSTDSDGAQQPFYGPFTGPTMHERRARWSLLSRRIAGATSSGKKRRKVEETASFVRSCHVLFLFYLMLSIYS